MSKTNKGIKIALGIGIVVFVGLFAGFFANELQKSFVTSDAKNLAFAATTAVFGIIAIGIGFSLKRSSAVSGGLFGGGVVALVESIVSYWGEMNSGVRLFLLGFVIAALVYLGIKKVKD